jgi:photosystem II stability/assembly factor-like uncharacterized protein
MRKIAMSALLTLCFFLSAFPREQSDGLPHGGRLDAIFFEDENHGYVRECCPETPVFFETRDGGRTWKSTSTPIKGLRRGRVFVNSRTGWSVVEDKWPHSSIYKTEDGGQTWRLSFQSPAKDDFYFDGLQVISDREVWVAGISGTYHTLDAGKTWTRVDASGGTLCFLDQQNGWIEDVPWVWKTSDGGKTWQKLPKIYGGLDLYFLDNSHGWLVGGEQEENLPSGQKTGHVYFTSDGGKTWNHLAALKGHFLWSVFFLNQRTGWVAGLDGSFLKTKDGGKSWFDPRTELRAE